MISRNRIPFLVQPIEFKVIYPGVLYKFELPGDIRVNTDKMKPPVVISWSGVQAINGFKGFRERRSVRAAPAENTVLFSDGYGSGAVCI